MCTHMSIANCKKYVLNLFTNCKKIRKTILFLQLYEISVLYKWGILYFYNVRYRFGIYQEICCVVLPVHHKSLGKSILFNGSYVLLPSEYFKSVHLKMIVRYIWILGKEKASKSLIFQGFLILLIV
jgi:hypothetical protein